MADKPRLMLASEIRKVLQRELGGFGLTVFVTQCSELNIRPEDIKPGDLFRLSQAIIRAVRPSAGDEKAQSVGKEIQKIKTLAELESLSGKEKDPLSGRRFADLYVNLGNLCRSTGEYEEGIKSYNKAIQFAKESDYELKVAEAYSGIGLIKEQENKWDEAIDYLHRGLELSERIDHPLGIAGASRWIGHLHWHKSEYDEALNWIEKSLENAKRTGDNGTIGTTMIEFGLVHSDRGEFKKAKKWLKESIGLVEKARNYRQVARVYNNLGDISLQEEEWKKALEHFDKCEEYASMINSQQMIGWSLFNSGEALVNMGELDEAIERAKRALKILEPFGEPTGIEGCNRVLALAYTKKKDWDEAEKHFEKSTKIVTEIESPYYLGQIHYDHACMYIAKGDKKKAKKLLNQAKKELKAIGAENLLARASEKLKEI